jgi:NADH:ubiquinone oxidoreductase subunit 6 (subunit J)
VNVSCILFLFSFEFLPISFVVIYVGAIAVLFLFVLMMLNIKLAELHESYYNFLPLSIFLGLFFIFEFLCVFQYDLSFINAFHGSSVYFLSDFLNCFSTNLHFNDMLSLFSNIKTISTAMFTDYLYCFLLSGFVLLLAMVSAIVLTLQKNFVSKTQNIYEQILRDFNSTLVVAS